MAKIRYAMSDEAIAKELGQRLARARINANLTQDELADAIGVDRGRISRLESAGTGKLFTLVAVMRHLDLLERLESCLPEDNTVSPLKQLESQTKRPTERQRVRKPKNAAPDRQETEEDLGW